MDGFLELRKNFNHHIGMVSVKEYSNVLSKSISKAPKSDWYRSLFVYDKDIIEHTKKNNGVGGYSGSVDAGYLCFDMDNKDLEVARADTIELLKRLAAKTSLKPVELVNHLEVFLHTKQRFSPESMKAICTDIAGDLSSFDTQIYNTTRIIRIENTLHQKSNRYKIAITTKQLSKLPVEDIINLASKKSKYVAKVSKLDFKFDVPKTTAHSVVVDVDEDDIRGVKQIDFSRCPRNIPRCIYALAQGIMIPGKGERHHIFRALARFYRNQGMAADQVHNQLKATARMNYKLYPETEKYSADRIWHVSKIYLKEKINISIKAAGELILIKMKYLKNIAKK